ncbi:MULTISPECIES: transposase [Rhodococcus]|uniref:Transposase n=1 Tax=Rhodococcus oxybenzonivorans TaxID=1990687 RepID=A0AAE4V4J3_9NOCA|nr:MULTISPECIES: transposase [Rhodococcus]MDV7245368.1 transposase [Rhodococcus oxybenzonivorans]MDV7268468.1 transposase [Rhodococcus oxybenzonivorans]MDV7272352.1 transposase [Rhodococcus oxybenzonivorans]MDV7336393.1 transposase [Rhodococcus oxybenzonivorans]MDV7347693.1 transposase [Rhodococcus oxybenzonivorans]
MFGKLFDFGPEAKRVNGRKRHLVTDTLGLLVVVLVTAGSVQDRDGGRRVLARAKTVMPSMVMVWADGGYAGKLVAWIDTHCRIALDIVRKPKEQSGFAVLPHRWVIERTLSWGCAVVASTTTMSASPRTRRSSSSGP